MYNSRFQGYRGICAICIYLSTSELMKRNAKQQNETKNLHICALIHVLRSLNNNYLIDNNNIVN